MSAAFYSRLKHWFEFDKYGLKTIPEQFNSPRSDCHAWSAHPLYHFFATICGIRPKIFAFKHVVISPNPGPLTELHCKLPHPDGEIIANMNFTGNTFLGNITLPYGITGEVIWHNNRLDLNADGKKKNITFNLTDLRNKAWNVKLVTSIVQD